MPDNNRKVLTESVITKLNSIYKFAYDADNNKIVVSLTTCKRVTRHDADKPFLIIVRKMGKKFNFSIDDINIWKEFQNDKKLKTYSLFDVHNTVNKLKLMYQDINAKAVSELLLSEFHGIKRV